MRYLESNLRTYAPKSINLDGRLKRLTLSSMLHAYIFRPNISMELVDSDICQPEMPNFPSTFSCMTDFFPQENKDI